ncbi:uncharacterized protein TNCV_4142731 [Trichonephila clavipes]|nr:uncharacterized protein TNCV_4142731 [Trichonephila clavipes]
MLKTTVSIEHELAEEINVKKIIKKILRFNNGDAVWRSWPTFQDETRKTPVFCGTPVNTIFTNNGFLQRRSVNISTGSVSILMNSDIMSLTAGNITYYVLKQQTKTEAQNNMNEGQDSIEKAQDSMKESQSNMQKTEEKNGRYTCHPSEEYIHIIEQAMTEALPTSNNDNSAHHDGSEKQDKRLTDTVDQHSFEKNTTSQLLSKKRQKKVILSIGVPIIIRNIGKRKTIFRKEKNR